MEWRLVRMQRDRISLENRTGDDVHQVVMQAVGSVVIGGRRDWSGNYDVIRRDASVELTWAKGWSPQRPGVRIAWLPAGDANARTRVQTVWLD